MLPFPNLSFGALVKWWREIVHQETGQERYLHEGAKRSGQLFCSEWDRCVFCYLIEHHLKGAGDRFLAGIRQVK